MAKTIKLATKGYVESVYLSKQSAEETYVKEEQLTTDYLTKTEAATEFAKKVNVTDIVNDCVTAEPAKPLSANQGKLLMDAVSSMQGGIHFKGTIGATGDIPWSDLPAPAATNNGWEYKVVEDHAETPVCSKGDYIISTGTAWSVDPTIDDNFEIKTNKTQTLSATSTNDQYPTAKATYDELVKKLDSESAESTYLKSATAETTYVAKANISTEIPAKESAVDTKVASEAAVAKAVDGLASAESIETLATTVAGHTTSISDLQTSVAAKLDASTAESTYLQKATAESSYATKSNLESGLLLKAEASDLDGLAIKVDTIEDRMDAKADASSVYTKDEANEKFIQSHQSLEAYAKTADMITALDLKADKTAISDMLTKTAASSLYEAKGAAYLKSETYSKDEADEKFLQEHQSLDAYAKTADVNTALGLKADKTEISDMLTKTEAANTYFKSSDVEDNVTSGSTTKVPSTFAVQMALSYKLATGSVETSFPETPSDSKVPSTKLVKTALASKADSSAISDMLTKTEADGKFQIKLTKGDYITLDDAGTIALDTSKLVKLTATVDGETDPYELYCLNKLS